MIKLSIKMRVTLWYTLFLTAVVIFVLIYIVTTGKSSITADSRNQLTKITEYNMDEIDFEDGELELDDDFYFFSEGVYTLIYSSNEQLIAGTYPARFNLPAPYLDGDLHQVNAGTNQYYVYDRVLDFGNDGSIWIRGIILIANDNNLISAMIQSAFILFPLLVIIAALGGYFITKKAFQPVVSIRQAAESITEGKDLSKRIQLPKSKDEIYNLAETINLMLIRLEQSFESEKQFTSDASHELRTPVAVINSNCEYALEHANTPEEYIECLEAISRQTNKMSKLISNLLTITRIDQGTTKLEFEHTNLSDLVKMICEEQVSIHPESIALTTAIDDSVFGNVDRSMFTRLTVNLIENAYQYGKEKGHIYISLTENKNTIVLTVQDDGIGIPENELENIWQRFYQINSSRTNQKGSMGLGLSMVKQIADLHHGTIALSSTLNTGSIFTLKFPKNHSIF